LKKASYIILLTILLLQAGGLLFLFQIQQVRVQKAALLQLDSNSGNTEKLALSPSEFYSARINDHELRLNGKLYDFKSVSYSDGQVILDVFHDASEENIINWIEALASAKGNQQGELPAHLVKLLTTTYLGTNSESVLFFQPVLEFPFFQFEEQALSFSREQDSPPPKKIA